MNKASTLTASFDQGWVRLWTEVRSLLPLTVFSLAAFIFFRDFETALIFVSGLAVHELGHAIALCLLRIECKIGFSWLGAWTESPLEKRLALGHLQNSLIHLSGPFFNILYAVLAMCLNAFWLPESDYLLNLANFNAMLAFLNLLPFGDLSDGGKVISRVLASQSGRSLAGFPLLLGASTLCGTAGFVFLFSSAADLLPFQTGCLLIAFWFTLSLLSIRPGERAGLAFSQKAMSRRAVNLLIAGLWLLVALSAALTWSTPFFIRAAQMVAMARWLLPFMIIGGLMLALLLLALFIHEAGHYLAGRMLGLRPARLVIGSPRTGRLWVCFSLAGRPVEVYGGLPLVRAVFDDPAFTPAGRRRRALLALGGPFASILAAMLPVWSVAGFAAGSQLALGLIADGVRHFYALPLLGLKMIGLSASPLHFWDSYGLALTFGLGPIVVWWILLNLAYGLISLLPFPRLDGWTLFISIFDPSAQVGSFRQPRWQQKLAANPDSWASWLLLCFMVFQALSLLTI